MYQLKRMGQSVFEKKNQYLFWFSLMAFKIYKISRANILIFGLASQYEGHTIFMKLRIVKYIFYREKGDFFFKFSWWNLSSRKKSNIFKCIFILALLLLHTRNIILLIYCNEIKKKKIKFYVSRKERKNVLKSKCPSPVVWNWKKRVFFFCMNCEIMPQSFPNPEKNEKSRIPHHNPEMFEF